MLVELSVRNCLSFKDKTTFSMQTAQYLKKFKKTNSFMSSPVNLLKSSIVIGPNGSGKSNLFVVLRMLRNILVNYSSDTKKSVSKLPYQPFKMDGKLNKDFIEIEIILLLGGKLLNYSISFNEDYIKSESLEILSKGKNEVYFNREISEDGKHLFNLSEEIADFTERTRKNAPYLSMLSQFNDKYAMEIIDWFTNKLIFIGTEYDLAYYSVLERLYDKDFKKQVLNLLKIADFNIVDIEIKEKKNEVPSFLREILPEDNNEEFFITNDIYTHYKISSESLDDCSTVPIHADSYESRGTKKMIIIATVLLDSLGQNKTIFIDEFDSAFHLTISKFLLKLFNSVKYNKNSQFILNTHELSLLDNDTLRVDQIWFAEKNKSNSTDIYSLYDFNKSYNRPRGDVSFATDYLKGKFGAVPVIDDFYLNEELDLGE